MGKLPFKAVTYGNQDIKYPHAVYALNKGNNSGKPSVKPYRNCFAVVCNSQEQQDQVFAALTLLYRAKSYEYYLIGSVIPFIRLGDFKTVLLQHSNLFDCPELASDTLKVNGIVDQIRKHAELQKKLEQLLIGYSRTILKKSISHGQKTNRID